MIAEYTNGNTHVTIMADGTKIREYVGIPRVIYPESIDVKITNYCDMGCPYCHETSTKLGNHADINTLLSVLSELPRGVELAIGGGNPLSHPDLIPLLQTLKSRGIIANLTVNQGHLNPYHDLIVYLIKDGLINGLGISITSNNFTYVTPLVEITDNIVFHLIAGVNKIEIAEKLLGFNNCKILVLGYKSFGLGVAYYNDSIASEIWRWHKYLPKLIGRCTLSFDNLAISQLNVKRLFTHEGWDKFYMGDDFCFSMYIDAVNKEYAPTSRSSNRIPFSQCSLTEYFSNSTFAIK